MCSWVDEGNIGTTLDRLSARLGLADLDVGVERHMPFFFVLDERTVGRVPVHGSGVPFAPSGGDKANGLLLALLAASGLGDVLGLGFFVDE